MTSIVSKRPTKGHCKKAFFTYVGIISGYLSWPEVQARQEDLNIRIAKAKRIQEEIDAKKQDQRYIDKKEKNQTKETFQKLRSLLNLPKF